MSDDRPIRTGVYHAGVWYSDDPERGPEELADDHPIKVYCEDLKAKLKEQGIEP